MSKKFFICGTLLGFLLGTVWGSNDPQIPSGYTLVGRINLSSPQQDSLYILKERNKENVYLFKVRRNTIDSRFMTPEAEMAGWIEIPIPIPFVGPIVKKHYIKYKESDPDWDYFTVILD